MIDTSYIPGNLIPVPFQLFDYQKPIVKSTIELIEKGDSGIIIQPTGTGKTIEAAFIARACILMKNMRGMYVYNANEGIEQARQKFQEIFNGNKVVCASFFGYEKDHHVGEADMVFASFQSLNSQSEKWYQMFDPKHFDFIIVNEGHYAQAPTYREVLDYFQCSKIAMTATPERMDKKDIREIFPTEIAFISLEEAIVNGWVARIEYHVLSSNLSSKKLQKICQEVLEEGKRVTLKQLNETVFVQKLDEQIIAEINRFSFSEMNTPQQVIVFCENIRHAEHTYQLFLKKGKRVGIMHSQKNVFQNRQTLQDFKDKQFQFIISVNQLNEDIDIPEATVGVFLRATESQTVWLQQIGRLLRKTPYKTKAIILDFVANIDRLTMVNQLSQSIEKAEKKLSQKSGPKKSLKLEKDILYVSGEGFEFSFSEEVMKLLDVVRIMQQNFYPTWQEASEAAVRLGITTKDEYRKRYKEDLRLPSDPRRIYKDFSSWKFFLKKERLDFYPTWQEAKKSVTRLGISTSLQYQEEYKKDNRLPSALEKTYVDFPGRRVFFGKEDIYDSLEDVIAAINKLGIISEPEYRKRYKEDPRLPSVPLRKFGLSNWYTLFNKEVPVEKYLTWQEASESAKSLSVQSISDYRKKHKKDLKLPAAPNSFYNDFPGWYIYLGKEKELEKYLTWQESSESAKSLGFKTMSEYKRGYKQDLRLHSFPERKYSDFPGWDVFLGKKKKK